MWSIDAFSKLNDDGSELLLKPVALFDDPFEVAAANKLVFCETLQDYYTPAGIAEFLDGWLSAGNRRHDCEKLLEMIAGLHPKLSVKQEYALLSVDGRPLGTMDAVFSPGLSERF